LKNLKKKIFFKNKFLKKKYLFFLTKEKIFSKDFYLRNFKNYKIFGKKRKIKKKIINFFNYRFFLVKYILYKKMQYPYNFYFYKNFWDFYYQEKKKNLKKRKK
jgi:hypothetical protein